MRCKRASVPTCTKDLSPKGDEIKSGSHWISGVRKPAFVTLHLSSLDTKQHARGPNQRRGQSSTRADRRLAGAAQRGSRAPMIQAAITMVASGHGFVTLTHPVNLLLPLLRANSQS